MPLIYTRISQHWVSLAKIKQLFSWVFPQYFSKQSNNNSGSAFIDLVIKYGWVSVTILYENNESMMRLKEIYTHTSKVKITNMQ